MTRALVLFLCLTAGLVARAADDGADFDRWFVGGAAQMLLPQGGSSMHSVGGACLRGGVYLTEDWALEGEAAWLEDVVGLSADVLGHLQGWSLYGDLFGYSRFDPFVTFGAKGWLGRAGQVGPKLGLGAFYHLTDSWALRFDADATLGLDSEVEVDYTLSVGVQYSF